MTYERQMNGIVNNFRNKQFLPSMIHGSNNMYYDPIQDHSVEDFHHPAAGMYSNYNNE